MQAPNSHKRGSKEPERVSDFLANQRQSLFIKGEGEKRPVPSSHILKTPNASVGNLNVSSDELLHIHQANKTKSKDGGDRKRSKDPKKSGTSDSEPESSGRKRSTRFSRKSETRRKSSSPRTSKGPGKKPKSDDDDDAIRLSEAERVTDLNQKLTGKSGDRKQSDDTSGDTRKKSDDTTADTRKKSDDSSSGRKTSGDKSDESKTADDKTKPEDISNQPKISDKTEGDKKTKDKESDKSGTPRTKKLVPVLTDEELGRSDNDEDDEKSGKKKKKGRKDKKDSKKHKKDGKKKGKKGKSGSESEGELEPKKGSKSDKKEPEPAKPRKYPSAKRSAEDDEIFQYLLDEESRKSERFSAYDAATLLREMPDHQWMLVPSIKWSIMRDDKERQLIQRQLEEKEAVRLKSLAEEELKGEEPELIELFPPRPLALSMPDDPCRPNPCPCKDKKREMALPSCKEPEIKQTPSEKCWQDYLARDQKERRMRWFTCVLLSAHTRRPNWIPPPEEYIRQQHQALKEAEPVEAPPPPEEPLAAVDQNSPDTAQPNTEVLESADAGVNPTLVKENKNSRKSSGGSSTKGRASLQKVQGQKLTEKKGAGAKKTSRA